MQTADEDALGALIRDNATRHRPSADLAARILTDSRAELPTPVPAWRRWLQPVALFGAGAVCTWVVSGNLLVASAVGRTADDIAASHVRSLMAAHLTDVASTDRHTVKPWFAGRLDFSPPVQDLADDGFVLAGGRLDHVTGRPVAALVYRQQQHVVNLFVWPAPAGSANALSSTAPDAEVRQGYNLSHWSQRGMQFWAASDASPQEMQRFTAALRARMEEVALP